MRSKVSSITILTFACVVAFILIPSSAIPAMAQRSKDIPVPTKIKTDRLSSGAKAWWLGPQAPPEREPFGALSIPNFGSNVDANDPNQDLAGGQSETAIAAAGNLVMAAWNDA